jgi:diketogulonate reductase-like aldo/keto reductase
VIGLMLVHQPAGDYIHGYQLLKKAHKEGKIRSLGVSNFSESQIGKLLAVCEVKPAVVQVECHPYYPQTELRKLLNEQDIALEAWFPLGHGDKSLINEPVFAELGRKYGKTPAQVILRWHTQMGFVVIPGSKNVDHIKDNLDIQDFKLTDEEMAEIAKLDKGERYYHRTDEQLA